MRLELLKMCHRKNKIRTRRGVNVVDVNKQWWEYRTPENRAPEYRTPEYRTPENRAPENRAP